MKFVAACTAIEAALARIGAALQSPLLLVVRGWWGWSFTRTGWGKLTHLERTTEYFASLNLPMPKLNALAAGGTECLGGLLLLVGLFSRVASPALIFVMLVAYVTADRQALQSIATDPDAFTGAAPFLFLFAALLVFAFGPGRYSVDAWVRKRP
ncbi:DoxX family protein [Opitutus terrae]|uniref:DoxX family protein n=1 Tax=Opitutus terrae (strain DSM 11246 / JCM 15787 / PB90-1) TaxID=452637 RepID=B1ZUH9_OPITP|nr:DoxX family membrane protein [Opitutus terrae]ACB74022.1 DoxX family protein [Opitutus terrae PB90-1]